MGGPRPPGSEAGDPDRGGRVTRRPLRAPGRIVHPTTVALSPPGARHETGGGERARVPGRCLSQEHRPICQSAGSAFFLSACHASRTSRSMISRSCLGSRSTAWSMTCSRSSIALVLPGRCSARRWRPVWRSWPEVCDHLVQCFGSFEVTGRRASSRWTAHAIN